MPEIGKISTVINLVDEFSHVNFGIWHAAIATSTALFEDYGCKTILVSPESPLPFPEKNFPFVEWKPLKSFGKSDARKFFSQFNKNETVIVSHGCWRFPTRWGSWGKNWGFKWMYVPHGMLEEWSLKQKWLKKKIYFHLIEQGLAKKAHWVRAVGSPEAQHLKKYFPNVYLIPNGIYASDFLVRERPYEKIIVFFLARLHFKKGLMPMVMAWQNSKLWKNPTYELVIGGTDDGEKGRLEAFLAQHPNTNIRFIGPTFGEEKRVWMQSAHYYILPSLSEGFPTSVLEAMAAGMLCMITPGCNFPEAIENKMVIKTQPDVESIKSTFNSLTEISENQRLEWVNEAGEWLRKRYLWSQISKMQWDLFNENQEAKR